MNLGNYVSDLVICDMISIVWENVDFDLRHYTILPLIWDDMFVKDIDLLIAAQIREEPELNGFSYVYDA